MVEKGKIRIEVLDGWERRLRPLRWLERAVNELARLIHRKQGLLITINWLRSGNYPKNKPEGVLDSDLHGYHGRDVPRTSLSILIDSRRDVIAQIKIHKEEIQKKLPFFESRLAGLREIRKRAVLGSTRKELDEEIEKIEDLLGRFERCVAKL